MLKVKADRELEWLNHKIEGLKDVPDYILKKRHF